DRWIQADPLSKVQFLAVLGQVCIAQAQGRRDQTLPTLQGDQISRLSDPSKSGRVEYSGHVELNFRDLLVVDEDVDPRPICRGYAVGRQLENFLACRRPHCPS